MLLEAAFRIFLIAAHNADLILFSWCISLTVSILWRRKVEAVDAAKRGAPGVVEVNKRHVISFGTAAVMVAPERMVITNRKRNLVKLGGLLPLSGNNDGSPGIDVDSPDRR
jgi:hypothetical protein